MNATTHWRAIALSLACLTASAPSRADPCEWNTSNGDWEDEDAWTNCATGYPNGAISALKDGGATATLNSNPSIENFELTAGGVNLLGTGGPHTLTVNGLLTLGNMSFSGDGGQVVAAGGATLSGGPYRMISNATLVNRDVMNVLDGTINMHGGGSGAGNLQNDAAGIIDLADDVLMDNGSFTNLGTLRKTTGTGLASSTSSLDNQGLIEVSSGTLRFTPLGEAPKNSGTMRAAAAAVAGDNVLWLRQVRLDNTGGVIEAADNARVDIEDATYIDFGTLTSTGTGYLQTIAGSSWINGVTLTGDTELRLQANLTRFEGTITNNGRILVQRTGGALRLEGDGDYDTFNDDVRFLGTGLLELGNGGITSNLTAGSTTRERLVNGPEHSIIGAGFISNIGGTGRLRIDNRGLIQATRSDEFLIIDPQGMRTDDAAGMLNSGTLSAADDTTLELRNGYIDNAGGLIKAGSGATVLLKQVRIDGGTLASAPDGELLMPTTFGGAGSQLHEITLVANSNLRVEGSGEHAIASGVLVNEGTVTVDATAGGATGIRAAGDSDLMTTSDDVVFSGNGAIALTAGSGRALITGQTANERFINGVGHRIFGPGEIGGNGLEIVNEGLIDGVLDFEGNVTQTDTGTLSLALRGLEDFEQVIVDAGDVVLKGTLELEFLGGFTPAAGDEFDLIQLDTSQTFDDTGLGIAQFGLDVGAQFSTSFDASTGVYTLTVLNDTTTSPPSIIASVLPASRSVEVGQPATAFATIINTGAQEATDCGISPTTNIPADFLFQTTDPATNATTGRVNAPVAIRGNSSQSFVIAFTPTATFPTTDVELAFDCSNTDPAPVFVGLNTLLLSASATPVPDVIALGATPSMDGIANVSPAPGAGVFTVATVNIGSGDTIDMTATSTNASLPLTIKVCETDPVSSDCVNPVPAGDGPVSVVIGNGDQPTFGIFLFSTGEIPFDPVNNRVNVRFTDSGGVIRGATSVAVRTFEP